MDNHYECPYCGWGSNDIEDIYEDGVSYETECGECEGVFHITVAYSANYSTHTNEVEKAALDRQKALLDELKKPKL